MTLSPSQVSRSQTRPLSSQRPAHEPSLVLVNAIVGFIQKYRAERAMEALANLVVTETTVRREGQKTALLLVEFKKVNSLRPGPGRARGARVVIARRGHAEDQTMNIVIGYDGSACADGAIEDLRRAGLSESTQAVVLSSADLLVEVPYAGCEDPASPYHMVPAEIVRQARQRCAQAISKAQEAADHGAKRLAVMFPSWKVTSRAVADSARWSLIETAEQWKSDLIVVGSHGRSLVGRLLMGSVSQNVLQHARCSVRIGRCDVQGPQRDADEPMRLVLALDGSPDSALAVDAVRLRAWPEGTEVHVVTVVDLTLVATDFTGWSDPDCGEYPLTHVSRRRADRVARELREAGLAAEPFVFEGDPKRVIVSQAEKWGTDCIFLGAKGHSRRERILLGSVSAAVAARAHCSVEVVRASA